MANCLVAGRVLSMCVLHPCYSTTQFCCLIFSAHSVYLHGAHIGTRLCEIDFRFDILLALLLLFLMVARYRIFPLQFSIVGATIDLISKFISLSFALLRLPSPLPMRTTTNAPTRATRQRVVVYGCVRHCCSSTVGAFHKQNSF